MTADSKTAKVCPRCGVQYENLKSTTCPQCFAVLVPVDNATAEELSAARAEVERSPEFQAAKAADDERFREQSFGACLAVAAITLLTVVVVIVLLVSGARHHNHGSVVPNPITTQTPLVLEPLTTLPVAAASLDDVLPPLFGVYVRQSGDARTILTGTLTPLFHAIYAAPTHKPFDVYVLPAGRPTSEQNEFRLGITLASQLGGADRPTLFFATEYWHFAVLAAPTDTTVPAAFRDALAAHFTTPSSTENTRPAP